METNITHSSTPTNLTSTHQIPANKLYKTVRLKGFMSRLVAVILLLTTLITTAFAGWLPSAGGGGSGGTIGSGIWDATMQGIRITILLPNGKPAFSYGSDRNMYGVDILYSSTKQNEICTMYGSSRAIQAIDGSSYKEFEKITSNPGQWLTTAKYPDGVRYTFMGPANLPAREGIGYAILSFDWLLDWITVNGYWKYKSPGDGNEVISNLNEIATTKPIEDAGSSWYRKGAVIANALYGDLNSPSPSDTAAIHAIFNIYDTGEGKVPGTNAPPVWKLTDDAIRYISNDTVTNAYNAGSKTSSGKFYSATELMELYNMAIVVEPIVWVRLRTSSSQALPIMLYGTPTNIAEKIEELHTAGVFNSSNWKKGGYDQSLMHATRASFVMSKDVEYAGVTFKSQPESIGMDTAANNIYQKDLGLAMHMYVCGSPSTVPGIPTYNPGDPNPGEPHTPEDPGPGNIPLVPGENPTPETSDGTGYKQTTRAINIVKVYDIEKLDGTVEHVATKAQKYNPVQISIQHEPSYKVVDYYTSPVYAGDLNGWDSNPSLIDTTTWNDLINNTAITKTESKTFNWDTVKDKEAGDEEALVKLGVGCDCDPTTQENGKHYNDTTLYVHLLLKEEPIDTHTFDDPDSPGSAPDPNSPDEGGPLTPQEQEQLKFNIVKVYETEDEYGTITTDSVTYRPTTAGIIEIEDEKDEPAKYELIEWLYSEEYKTGDSWDNIVGGIGIIGSGDKVDWCKESELRYSFPMASQHSPMVPIPTS